MDLYIFLKGINMKWNANNLVQDWTLVADSIPYDDNDYAKCASILPSVTKVNFLTTSKLVKR